MIQERLETRRSQLLLAFQAPASSSESVSFGEMLPLGKVLNYSKYGSLIVLLSSLVVPGLMEQKHTLLGEN